MTLAAEITSTHKGSVPLHGIGGDETEWQRFASPNVILDNLIADGKAVPMIVVMPNGRAQKNEIDHVWHVDDHGHDPQHWSSGLYWFLRSVFQDNS